MRTYARCLPAENTHKKKNGKHKQQKIAAVHTKLRLVI